MVTSALDRDAEGTVVLQVTPSKSPKRAIRYFMQHLERGDYYQGEAIDQRGWEGKEIARLGLDGKTCDLKTFAALTLNVDPSKVDDDFVDRVKESLKPPPKLDLDTLKVGTRVHVPNRGEGRVVELDGCSIEVRLDGAAKEQVTVDVDDLKSPERKLKLNRDERLTPRHRPTAGWDYTFSVPKGVSLVWAAGDKRVEGVLDKAIAKTMSRIESYAQARVRLGSGDNQMDEQRDTGNLVWVGFTHETARPVRHPDGEVTVDPHLHRHVFVHNLTYDPVEERWKAMKNRAMFERTAYFQEIFESYLARFVHELGYRIDRRGKLWDIADVSPELAARYSLRTKEVNDYAEEKGITNAAVKGELGARSRSVKSLATDVGDIADHFRERSLDDFDYSERLRVDAQHRERFLLPDGPLSPRQRKELLDAAVDYALERAFERRSTAYAHMVLADAIRFAGAGRCLPEEVQQALLEREGLIFGTPDGTHRQLLTTTEIVEQERSLLKVVRDLRDAHLPLVVQPRIDRQLSP